MDELRSLEKIGLTEKEIIILKSLLASNEGVSITELEQITSLPRTTVHRMISQLVKRGLLRWRLGNQGKKVEIADFSAFINTLKVQQNDVDIAIQSLTKLNAQKETNSYSKISIPKIRYYEGSEGIKQLIWNTLDAKGELFAYTNIMRREIVGERWLIDYCLEFVNKNIQDKVLCDMNYAKNSYQKYGGREKYFAPITEFYKRSQERVFQSELMKIKGETYIYNNILAAYSQEGDALVGCEIESYDIADTQKSIFLALWNQTSTKDNVDNFIME